MGYTTEFEGFIEINPPLDQETADLINGLSETRRVKRDIKKLAELKNMSLSEAQEKYGEDGEFYYDPDDFKNCGQTPDISVVESGDPPPSQPSLWLNWIYDPKTNSIIWNEGEKFYEYVAWMEYLIEKIIKPRGYQANGEIYWRGESFYDVGRIGVEKNVVETKERIIV